MVKDIFRKAKISIIAVITALFCVNVPQISNITAAVEGGTDIRLKIQTKDIDIHDIPDNGIVDLDITIENNPTIDCLSLVFEKDSRVQFNQYDLFDHTYGGISNSGYSIIESNSNAIYSDVIFGVYPDDENGVFVKIKIKLPDKNEIKKDDFFPVRFLNSCDWAVPSVGVLTPEIKILNGSEYFGGFEDGGIRITDNTPVQPVQNDPESQPQGDQPAAQPVQDQNNGPSGQVNNNNNIVQQPAAGITTPTVTVSQTAPVLTSSVTTKKVTKATSVSTSVSEEYTDTESEKSTQTNNTDTEMSVSDTNNEKSKTKIIICVAAITVVLASVLAIAIKNINKKRRENNEK